MTKTKTNKKWVSLLPLAALLFFWNLSSQAQVTFTQNFNANATGWTGNIVRTTATTACGSASMRRNLYSGAPTGNMVSPLIGSTTGGTVTISYKYKVANWSANTVGTPNPWGSFNVQYGASATGPWTTVQTINSSNHIVSATCTTATVTFTPPAAQNLFVKWDAFWTSGDYYLNFDDVSIIIGAGSLCAGVTPPGNTLATNNNTCAGTATTLSFQNGSAGTGLSYQWQTADDAAFTVNVNNVPSATATTFVTTVPNVPTYYRCAITCSAGPTTDFSSSLLLNPVSPNPGNTNSTATLGCPIAPFTLSLQNAVAGTATYQWQSADDAAFTTNLVTLATTSTATYGLTGQASAKYYRCIVTCAGGSSAISNAFFLPQGAPNQCYCIPTTTYGCGDNDVIAQVTILNGTTPLYTNNSGTGCPSDPVPGNQGPNVNGPGYSDYTNLGSVANLTAGNTYNFQVFVGTYSEGFAAWIDYNDDGVFAASERIGFTVTAPAGSGLPGVLGGSATFPVTLACNPPSGTHRLRVRCVYATAGSTIDPCLLYTYGESEDYLITIDPALPCPAPSNFSLNTPTISGATFAWTIGCVETNWELEFGPVGFAPGTGSVEAATTNPYTATTMPCGSTLDVYLRANCLGNGYSTYVGPLTLTTSPCPCNGAPALANTLASVTGACSGTPFNLSLDQNYSGLTGITYLWETSPDNITWTPTTGTAATYSATQSTATYYHCIVTCTTGPVSTTSNSILVGQNPPNQCYCIPGYSYGIQSGDLISNVQVLGTTLSNNSGTAQSPNISYTYYDPTIYTAPNYTATLTAGNTYQVSVSIGAFSSQGVSAWVDYNDDGVFSSTERIGSTPTTIGTAFGTAVFPITLSCAPLPGPHRLRIRCAWITNGPTIDPCATYGWGEAEDYLITIAPPDPCPAPSAFAYNTPTPTGVTFTWNNGCVETDWEIEFGAPGFIPGTGTIEAATSNPYTATTMTCGTTYDVYLRANCLGNGYSTYVGPISVTTGLCPCTVVNPGNTLSSASSVCASQSFTLSLQNPTAGSGVSYQWYWSLDGITYSPVGGNTATLTLTQSVPYWYYCDVTCSNGPIVASSTPVFVGSGTPTVGIDQATAIAIGQLPSWTTPYVDTKNNSCYPNSGISPTNQVSGDIWYSFTLCSTSDINISLCSSSFDTYLHLLDNTGAEIAFNDDFGPLCSSSSSSISQFGLAAGTYYIVTEGYSSNTGDITLQVGTTAAATCSATLNLKCFIQGYYITDNTDPNYQKMRPVLFNQLGAPFTTNDCDTITVELHDATAPYAIATGIPAFVGKLDINGNLACTFPAAAVGGNYYIALKHRNSLQTWSAAPVTIAAVTSYDFTNLSTPGPDNKSYGPNQFEVEPGIWALISGDITNDGVSDVQDGSVDAFDYTKQDPLVINGDCGYYAADLNGDGCVDAFDYVLLDPNLIIGYTINIPQ